MSMLRWYHFETLSLVVFAWSMNAMGGESLKPQVLQSAKPTPGLSPAAETVVPPTTPPPAAANNVPALTQQPPGKPILYGTPNSPVAGPPVATPNTPPRSEAGALNNAFGSMLPQLMGSMNGGGGLFGTPGIADSVGDSGIGYGRANSSAGMTPISPSEFNGTRKIMAPFRKWFDHCTKEKLGLGDCRFVNKGIMGDAAHRARPSCHNAGEAIDVGTVTCSGGQKIEPSSDLFLKLADCLANGSSDQLQVIFHRSTGGNMIQKSDHAGHMHVQLKNCRMVYGM